MLVFRMMISAVVISVVALSPSWLIADTCYEDGEATCEELSEITGYDCDSTECFKVQLIGWFCNETETMILPANVDVAVHVQVGLESFTTSGSTVNCKQDRRCKGYCGFPAEGEVLMCESGTGDWEIDSSKSFAHTYASGEPCNPY